MTDGKQRAGREQRTSFSISSVPSVSLVASAPPEERHHADRDRDHADRADAGRLGRRGRARGVLMAGNHDHSQFNLLLGREFIAMFPVVLVDLCRRNNGVRLYVLAAHRSHNDFFHLLLFELAQRAGLRNPRVERHFPFRLVLSAKPQ